MIKYHINTLNLGVFTVLKNVKAFLSTSIHIKTWELMKYFLISVLIYSPALISFFNHTENQYYCRLDNLLAFLAFAISTFTLFLILRISMKWTIPFIIFSVICDAYHLTMGKPIGFQTMAAMYETNFHEILGFLSSPFSIPLILGGAASVTVLIFYITRDKPLWGMRKETSVKKHYLIILSFSALTLFALEGKSLRFTYPIDVFYTNYCYIYESSKKDQYLKTPYNFPDKNSPSFTKRKPGLYILIIGEAARRTALHAYGAKVATTPFLDKFIKSHPDNVILFKNAISAAPYTRGSVPTMLSTYDLKNIKKLYYRPSLSKMFNGAGFKTMYITTRPKYFAPNIVSIFQDDAKQHIYLSKFDKIEYDETAIPQIRKFINSNSDKNRFLIFHLMGSHIKYSMQYPPSHAFFHSGDEMHDTYYDSIRYTDFIIQKVIDMLMKQKVPGFLLYASDHGENLNDYGDGNYGHGTRELTHFEFEIPFIIYMNNAFIREYPQLAKNMRAKVDSPIAQDNISHTLLAITGVKDKRYYNIHEDLSSEKFKTQQRNVIDENMNIYDFDKLQLYKRKRIKHEKSNSKK